MTEVDILMISGLLGTCVVVYGDVGTGHRVPWIFLCVSSAKHCQQQSAAQRSYPSGHTEWSASLPLSPSLFTYIHTHALTSRHSSQTTTTFCLINVSRLSTVGDRAFPVAATHLWNSLPSHVTAPLSLSIFCCRLKSHLFSLSYPAFWLFSHLYSDSSFWTL